jgi:DUF971 family protein
VKIDRVQYDGAGQWLDVVFSDGVKARFPAGLVRALVPGAVVETFESKRFLAPVCIAHEVKNCSSCLEADRAEREGIL